MKKYIETLIDISTELAIGTQSRAEVAIRIDELIAQMYEDYEDNHNYPTADFPLGGSIEPYDIAKENEIINE